MCAAELKDFRGKITTEADVVLESVSRTTGRERQEIAREVLHRWAMEQIHAATVMDRLLKGEGLPGIAAGVAGSVRESGGVSGNRRECG